MILNFHDLQSKNLQKNISQSKLTKLDCTRSRKLELEFQNSKFRIFKFTHPWDIHSKIPRIFYNKKIVKFPRKNNVTIIFMTIIMLFTAIFLIVSRLNFLYIHTYCSNYFKPIVAQIHNKFSKALS